MTSSRLPGKTLKMVKGVPVIRYLTDRISNCRTIDDVIIATSTDDSDDPIIKFADELSIATHRGPLNDVASRVLGAALQTEADAVVRISGDSPLLDSAIVDQLVTIFRSSSGVDVVTNVFPRTFPRGQSVEVISVESLRARFDAGLTVAEREHVTLCFYNNPGGARIINVRSDGDYGDIQLSVDSPTDLARFSEILDILARPYASHGLHAVISAYKEVEHRRHLLGSRQK